MRFCNFIFFGVLLGATAWSEATSADILPVNASGWHTWQVDEPGTSTEMCCFTRSRGLASRKGCNLDGGNMTFSDGGDCAAPTGSLQVYVRLANGQPQDIRVMSSNCPVATQTEITDHGVITAGENVDWFRAVVEDKSLNQDVREEALFGLVQSESDAAYAYLERLLTQNREQEDIHVAPYKDLAAY